MPKQDWTINTKAGYAGEQYGLATTNSQRLTFLADAAVTEYGLAVKQGKNSNSFAVGLESDGSVLGITMREDKLEAAKRPSDGTVLIPQGQPLAVMLEGPVLVMAQTAITGKDVGVNAQGQFGAVGGDFTAVNNVVALEYPVAAGDVFPVMVRVFAPKQ